jgi:cytochrome c1
MRFKGLMTMKMMKKITLCCVTGVVLTQAPTVWASNVENGKRLYGEDPNKCLMCHATPSLFTREDRKAKNLTGLENWVRRCDIKAKTKWYDDEISDVVAYLNQQYYRY